MTSHSDDDPLLRDPRFDRTWRAVSAEEPPPRSTTPSAPRRGAKSAPSRAGSRPT